MLQRKPSGAESNEPNCENSRVIITNFNESFFVYKNRKMYQSIL
jgi:hypothetical protein